MIRRLQGRPTRSDGGFTLVELMAYIVILAILLAIAASLFINILTSQRDIRAMAEANNTAQVLFKQLEDDLRNAAWAETKFGGDLLVTKTRSATGGNESTPRCVAYFYDDADSTLYRTASPQPTDTEAVLGAVDEPAARALAVTWTQSFSDVGPIVLAGVEQRIFGTVDQRWFEPDGVSIRLSANTIDGHKPIDLVKTVGLRPQSSIAGECE